MLTLEPDEFAKKALKSNNPRPDKRPEAYHYLKLGDYLFRSQLDCYHPDIPSVNKTFDLKTRATFAIRLNVESYRTKVGYKLDKLIGDSSSYEHEFYDVIRAGFLKFCWQVRLGHMNGIFMAYHNTKEMFGFEYIPIQEMDSYIFGSTSFADTSFDIVMKLFQRIISSLTALFPNETLQLTFWTDRTKKEMNIFVERIPRSEDRGWGEGSADVGEKKMFPLHLFKLHLDVVVNGRRQSKSLEVEEGDKLQVHTHLYEVSDLSQDQLHDEFGEILKRSDLYVEFAE